MSDKEKRIKELEEAINSLIHSIEDNVDDYLVMQEACDKAKLLLLPYNPEDEHEKDLILSLTLAYSVIAWWEDNKDDMIEREFVKLAFDITKGENVF